MQSTYKIGEKTISNTSQAWVDLITNCYIEKKRPLCMCSETGVEMYIARSQDKYIVKRMPNTGRLHDPLCDSYEPPHELSGLAEVAGSAIKENPYDGITTLRIDFSLSKHGSRNAPPPPSGVEHASVKAKASKLTLRAVLHYLWEEAGFNRWSPAMRGKRNWTVIRKYLLQAAEGKNVKGTSLADVLYIPETFSIACEEEINANRIARMKKISSDSHAPHQLMLVVGEIKCVTGALMDYKVVLKHLPKFPFKINEDIYKRLRKRFESELGLFERESGEHLILIGTFSINLSGTAVMEEIALMIANENWIPFENVYDEILVNKLIESERRFTKGLRYNLNSAHPLASAVLSDTSPPTAMYVVPPGIGECYVEALGKIINEGEMPHWRWDIDNASDIPALPAKSARNTPSHDSNK